MALIVVILEGVCRRIRLTIKLVASERFGDEIDDGEFNELNVKVKCFVKDTTVVKTGKK